MPDERLIAIQERLENLDNSTLVTWDREELYETFYDDDWARIYCEFFTHAFDDITYLTTQVYELEQEIAELQSRGI